MDTSELTGLKQLPRNGRSNNGKKMAPLVLHVNGHAIYLPEWSQMRSAGSTAVKLILAARFSQKLDAVWPQLDPAFRDVSLGKMHRAVRAILRCFESCCHDNVVEFCRRWGNPFSHVGFNSNCCSDRLDMKRGHKEDLYID